MVSVLFWVFGNLLDMGVLIMCSLDLFSCLLILCVFCGLIVVVSRMVLFGDIVVSKLFFLKIICFIWLLFIIMMKIELVFVLMVLVLLVVLLFIFLNVVSCLVDRLNFFVLNLFVIRFFVNLDFMLFRLIILIFCM